jgi:DNA modification methylase
MITNFDETGVPSGSPAGLCVPAEALLQTGVFDSVEATAGENPERQAYIDFLMRKIPKAEVCGFEPLSPPHNSLFPHQSDICHWGIRGGRRAIFANFGLGKTRMHLQIAKWVTEKTGGKFLIICPLGVRQEFTQSDGPAMGIPIHFVRTTTEVESIRGRVFVTNYESVRDGKIDVNLFQGVGMDEASVLRSYGSKTYQTFLPMFKSVPYRFVFTATPSPNRYKELIHYAGFLGVMDTGEALTRFFQRDSSQAGNLTLYPHMEQQFWLWLASWAAFIQRPSDLGYSDEGYDLPEINVHWHRLEVDHTKAWSQFDGWGQSQMFMDQAVGLKESAETKRESIEMRVAKAHSIVNSEWLQRCSPELSVDDPQQAKEKHWIIWHDLEDERRAIEKAFPLAKTVYGSQDLDDREELIMGFSRGEYRILATKPIIAGSGCNFQRHCADAVFLGVGYKFNDFIQAIHRIHRFQQKREVNIHIVHLDSEDAIVADLKAKWQRHDELQRTMTGIMRKYKLSTHTTMELIRTLTTGGERAEVRGNRFRVIRNDTTLELMDWFENQVDMILTSIPFGNQYEYSPSFNDFGHNSDNEAFFQQMDHLCPQLLKVLKPGRIAAIHVKDRIRFGNVTGDGFPTVDPFSDMTVAAFRKAGFRFMARITIDTDVVRENNQTYRLGWSENAKDSSKMGAGMPEYVLIFRKLPSDQSNGYADVPVVKPKEEYTRADWQLDAAGLWRSNGNRLPDPEILKHMPHDAIKRLWIEHSRKGGYDHEEHVEIAKALESMGKLPSSFMLFPPISRKADIWDDIARMRTLNSEQSRRNQENHVCPLQLDIIKRLITRYTNADDVVYDPFLGIGSTAFQAIKMGRHGWGSELNEEYWRCAFGYCEAAESQVDVPTLFDMAAGLPAGDERGAA